MTAAVPPSASCAFSFPTRADYRLVSVTVSALTG